MAYSCCTGVVTTRSITNCSTVSTNAVGAFTYAGRIFRSCTGTGTYCRSIIAVYLTATDCCAILTGMYRGTRTYRCTILSTRFYNTHNSSRLGAFRIGIFTYCRTFNATGYTCYRCSRSIFGICMIAYRCAILCIGVYYGGFADSCLIRSVSRSV